MQLFLLFFFFSSRRRHTRSDRDWSSDVCSSDLLALAGVVVAGDADRVDHADAELSRDDQIGRASCRERGVDLGGRRIIKKKKKDKADSVDAEGKVNTMVAQESKSRLKQ